MYLRGIRGVLKGLLQESYKDNRGVLLHGCYNGVTLVFHGCYRVVTGGLRGCYMGVTGVLLECDKGYRDMTGM